MPAEVVDPADFDAANGGDHSSRRSSRNQTVKNASDGTTDDQTLKAALSVAVNKALLGDTSTYELHRRSVHHLRGRYRHAEPMSLIVIDDGGAAARLRRGGR